MKSNILTLNEPLKSEAIGSAWITPSITDISKRSQEEIR